VLLVELHRFGNPLAFKSVAWKFAMSGNSLTAFRQRVRHAAGDILAAWLQDMSDAYRAKDGWRLFFAACATMVAFIGGGFTAYSIVENLSAARRAEAIGRGDKIEQSLRSKVIWERFWGLENLESYPAEYPALLLENRQLSTPFEFSKRVLVDYIDRFNLHDGRQVQILSGSDQLELV
jgi:hypothetical protein